MFVAFIFYEENEPVTKTSYVMTKTNSIIITKAIDKI